MTYFTYILLCSNGKYYTGHTRNVKTRLERHAKKQGAKLTSQIKPISIVWKQKFNTELEAIGREKQIKGWTRKKKQKLIKGIWS
jgi:predicted GIY-YIG superfamily endonuclease